MNGRHTDTEHEVYKFIKSHLSGYLYVYNQVCIKCTLLTVRDVYITYFTWDMRGDVFVSSQFSDAVWGSRYDGTALAQDLFKAQIWSIILPYVWIGISEQERETEGWVRVLRDRWVEGGGGRGDGREMKGGCQWVYWEVGFHDFSSFGLVLESVHVLPAA